EDHVVLGRLADADDVAGEDLLAPRRPAAHDGEPALLQLDRLHRNASAAASTSGGMSWPPSKATKSTVPPAPTSSPRRRSASSYGRSGAARPWLWNTRSGRSCARHSRSHMIDPENSTSPANGRPVRRATSSASIAPCEKPPRTVRSGGAARASSSRTT